MGQYNIRRITTSYGLFSSAGGWLTREREVVEDWLECFQQASDLDPCAEVQTAPPWRERLGLLDVALKTDLQQQQTCHRHHRLVMTNLTTPAWQQHVKGKGVYSCLWIGNPSHSYWVTCHMGSHSVTLHRHRWMHPALTLAMQAGTRFTYPRGMEGWVDLGGWLYTEMVYLSVDSHPSK